MDSAGPAWSSIALDLYMVLRDIKVAFVRPPPRDLGVRGVSIVRCGLSYLVDLSSEMTKDYLAILKSGHSSVRG